MIFGIGLFAWLILWFILYIILDNEALKDATLPLVAFYMGWLMLFAFLFFRSRLYR